jgi:hypothetical protein
VDKLIRRWERYPIKPVALPPWRGA